MKVVESNKRSRDSQGILLGKAIREARHIIGLIIVEFYESFPTAQHAENSAGISEAKTGEIVAIAAPPIIPGHIAEPFFNWISMNVSNRFKEIIVGFDGNAFEAILENMPNTVSERVKEPSIFGKNAMHYGA